MPSCSIDPTTPKVMSDLVTKLLQKFPDLRCQSANGLLHDVDKIQAECDNNSLSSSNDIALDEYDFSSKLFTTQKLHGRANEASMLHSAFDMATSNGSLEVSFAKALSGIGKHY